MADTLNFEVKIFLENPSAGCLVSQESVSRYDIREVALRGK